MKRSAKPVGEGPDSKPAAAGAAPAVSGAETASAPAAVNAGTTETEIIAPREPEPAPAETVQPAAGSVPAVPRDAQSGRSRDNRGRKGAPRALAAGIARTKIKQATTAARGKLEDNVRPRVEKIRQASSVVLEEAAYDPSVRFILVAGALFVLFVVLLIISKII